MLTRDILKRTIANLPGSFMIDELIEQLLFIEKVEEGLKQSEEGKTISNEVVKSRIEKWSS
ncbi:MAG: hypothetical protein KUL83_01915 [Lentimicrobium sp.]|jgi:Zn-dependent alcohol dehydrogenase|nr:hypothetical protein [Lentimicrobium sp.]MDD2528542.1 hypothetical protein [Lentimicrobiaceae bacterium]MDD4596519.1 hypothetical protein [Lentimicrobiaceae bacterium]MDY0026677.1 hypothetical protein [Lentimicrobium sp.]HAH57879.1 hypothetical protein [Bacteroidales bacterium]